MSIETKHVWGIYDKRYEEIEREIRETVDQVIRPNAETTDRESRFPRENLEELARRGFNGILLPKELGGLGLDHVLFALVTREIARACPSTALVYTMHVGAAQTILLFGNEEQKERWLKPVRQGKIGTLSTSEKATGGHWWYNLSEAVRTDDGYRLKAEKSFTTSGGQADFYVFQTKSPNASKPDDLSYFIVDGQLPGIKAVPWEALGVKGNHSGPLSFQDVHVKSGDLLGEEGQGKDIIYNGVSPIYLIGIGATWSGVAQGLLDAAAEYATSVIYKDFKNRLSDYQVIRSKLAEAKVLVESLKPWQNELARRLDQWLATGDLSGANELIIPLTEFKVHTSEVANQVAQIALDISGGYGYKRGLLERLYRDARAGIVMGPSNHIAREWIGKVTVGIPLELWYKNGE
jgi:alkylation response protein AidB-like acyl-CoA dehydrogenase